VAGYFYIYGVVGKEIILQEKGFGGKPIQLIESNGLFALFSIVSEKSFSQDQIDKNVKDLKWLAENAPVHESIIESAMQQTTVLPFKFCTIFKTKGQVQEMLAARSENLLQNLLFLKGKIEVGVKAYYNTGETKNALREEMPKIKQLEEQKKKEKEGKAYFTQQKIDSLLKASLEQKIADSAGKIFDALAKEAVESKANQLLKTQKGENPMALNAVFLIEKEKRDSFTENAKGLAVGGLAVTVSKAFPPYNFVK